MKFFFVAVVMLYNILIEPIPSEVGGTPDSLLQEITNDSLRIVELNHFWNELAESVRKGDLDKYASAYHDDAVVVFAEKKSVPIEVALEGWKQGFVATKDGSVISNVEFRFSERIGDETTAFEKGMFKFSVNDRKGLVQDYYGDLQALMVKKNGSWLCLMEYQKTSTEEKWNCLEGL